MTNENPDESDQCIVDLVTEPSFEKPQPETMIELNLPDIPQDSGSDETIIETIVPDIVHNNYVEKKPAEEKKSTVAKKARVEKKPKVGKKLPKEGGYRRQEEEEDEEGRRDLQDLHLQGVEAGSSGHRDLEQGHGD
ncbi:hypothetical protein ACSBR1_001640 [Camellia fascicularis]